MPRLDLDVVRHALSTARRHGFSEVELDLGEDHFHAKLMPIGGSVAAAVGEPVESETAAEAKPAGHVIAASAVGYYQEGEVPLRIGVRVEKGDRVATIVALGLANDVESKWAGEVVEVFATPEQPVEYGQPLARVL